MNQLRTRCSSPLRNPTSPLLALVASFIVPAICAADATAQTETYARATEPLAVVRGLTEAFNAHDTTAMLAWVAKDIKWFSVGADSSVIEAAGHEALENGMKAYFSAIPGARSEIEESIVVGSFISVRERAFWQGKDGEKSQAVLAVYEVAADKIARVWYFPAQK